MRGEPTKQLSNKDEVIAITIVNLYTMLQYRGVKVFGSAQFVLVSISVSTFRVFGSTFIDGSSLTFGDLQPVHCR